MLTKKRMCISFSGRNEIEKGEAKKDLCTRLQISFGLHKFRDFSTILLPAVKHFASPLHQGGGGREGERDRERERKRERETERDRERQTDRQRDGGWRMSERDPSLRADF